ncbi:hypothetical protein LCGC14_0347540 [marine sediment metagenome]|uniref:Uncharacterized protein n=1 Tax=marine sediment metagenome TaxID=412755 RepID=A0A0F9TUP8_9ZZZZ
MYPSKIISGGQTGADMAGLEAAAALELETGGTAPYNWMTEDGYKKPLLVSYGLVAGPYDPRTYPIRTKLNVQDSDGTLLTGNSSSPGSRLTRRYCIQEGKPWTENPTPENLRAWLRINAVHILNVAGNRESRNPGIFASTVKLLLETIDVLKSYDMVCLNCNARRNIELTEVYYQEEMDSGGILCTDCSITNQYLMVPFSSLQ